MSVNICHPHVRPIDAHRKHTSQTHTQTDQFSIYLSTLGKRGDTILLAAITDLCQRCSITYYRETYRPFSISFPCTDLASILCIDNSTKEEKKAVCCFFIKHFSLYHARIQLFWYLLFCYRFAPLYTHTHHRVMHVSLGKQFLPLHFNFCLMMKNERFRMHDNVSVCYRQR